MLIKTIVYYRIGLRNFMTLIFVLAAYSLNKLRQLSYLLPHLPLGSCGGVGVVVRGASGQATERRGLRQGAAQ